MAGTIFDSEASRKGLSGGHGEGKEEVANLLVSTNLYLEDEAGEEQVATWEKEHQECDSAGAQLSSQQGAELMTLLATHKDVLCHVPGHTKLVEHHTETAKPIRLPPYQLPHAYWETVHQKL